MSAGPDQMPPSARVARAVRTSTDRAVRADADVVTGEVSDAAALAKVTRFLTVQAAEGTDERALGGSCRDARRALKAAGSRRTPSPGRSALQAGRAWAEAGRRPGRAGTVGTVAGHRTPRATLLAVR